MKRIHISAVFIIPEVVLYKYLHSDLSFWHARIIKDDPRNQAKRKRPRIRPSKKTRLNISDLRSFVGELFPDSPIPGG
ncbi:MAG: hypothetical protein WAV20_11315 [Blastocatellia bacterium]